MLRAYCVSASEKVSISHLGYPIGLRERVVGFANVSEEDESVFLPPDDGSSIFVVVLFIALHHHANLCRGAYFTS